MKTILLIGVVAMMSLLTACDHIFVRPPPQNYASGGPMEANFMGDVCNNSFGTPAGNCTNGYYNENCNGENCGDDLFHFSNPCQMKTDYYNSGYYSGFDRGFARGLRNGYQSGFYDGYYHW